MATPTEELAQPKIEEAENLKLGKREIEKKEDDNRENVEGEGMKPWEQHSAVISIPRYDYKAASSFLGRSLSGFLITCPIKREKSATKEVMSIFEKFVSSVCVNDSIWLKSCNEDNSVKKRKIYYGGTKKENVEDMDGNGDGDTEIYGKTKNINSSSNLSLVKLTRSGLLLFTCPSSDSQDVVSVLSQILFSLGSGELQRPVWCNRIFPIQETCILTEKNLHVVVSKLVQEYLGKDEENIEKDIKFAVGYNRRGFDETEMKTSKSLLDRDACFKIVAGAFKEVAKNATVDLKSPEVAVLVELLPISGVPQESPVVGVSILSNHLFSSKPKLSVKPLIVDTKPVKRTG